MDRRLDAYLRIKSALFRTPPIKVKNYNVNEVADATGKWLKGINDQARWGRYGAIAGALGLTGLVTAGGVGLAHAITENNRRQKEIYDKLMENKNKKVI